MRTLLQAGQIDAAKEVLKTAPDLQMPELVELRDKLLKHFDAL